eukprot:jgi/Psemu1/41877/gm1.41877_g
MLCYEFCAEEVSISTTAQTGCNVLPFGRYALIHYVITFDFSGFVTDKDFYQAFSQMKLSSQFLECDYKAAQDQNQEISGSISANMMKNSDSESGFHAPRFRLLKAQGQEEATCRKREGRHLCGIEECHGYISSVISDKFSVARNENSYLDSSASHV